MPSKKKKYNARFPPARIKKIMQSDEEVGKVAQAVPVIISRALELFVESLLKKAEVVTQARNAKTLTPSHLKQCIMMEGRFDFLRDLVSTVSDVQGEDDGGSGAEVGGRVGPSGTESETYNYPVHQGVIQTTGTVPSTSSAASTATRPEVGQHPLPSYASGISDYMSLQQNQQAQQHPYVKPESAGASGGPNVYMPQAPVRSSTMTNNSNQQQQHIQQHSQPIFHTGQPSQVIIHHDSYIPQHHQGAPGGYPHPQLPQHPEHGRHFFYGQYDHSNGQVRPEPTADNTQAYGEHGGYGYDRAGQHY